MGRLSFEVVYGFPFIGLEQKPWSLTKQKLALPQSSASIHNLGHKLTSCLALGEESGLCVRSCLFGDIDVCSWWEPECRMRKVVESCGPKLLLNK